MPFRLLPRHSRAALLALVFVATACGGADTTVVASDDGPAQLPVAVPDTTEPAEPDVAADITKPSVASLLPGRTFTSTQVLVDGVEKQLVDGTHIELRFGPDELGIDAGCNSMSVAYRVGSSTIDADGGEMTEMGCDPERHAQDDFVLDFILGDPVHRLLGNTLILTSVDDTIDITFVSPEPPRPVTGTRWEVTGFFNELTAWATVVTQPAVINLEAGSVTGPVGCDGGVAMIPSNDERSIFSVRESALVGWCPDAVGVDREYVADLEWVLAVGDMTIEIDGDNLRMTASDGYGLTAIALD